MADAGSHLMRAGCWLLQLSPPSRKLPPKSAASSGDGDGGSTVRKSREGPPPSVLPPAIPEIPITFEDSFVDGHSVDPVVPLPLEPYDEQAQLQATRGHALHKLLEEDEAASSAYTSELARLQAELSRHTKSTTEMVKYLEAEVRRKDLMGKRMTRQLADLRATHQSELALMERHFENTSRYMEKLFLDKEKQMLALNENLEGQIADMSELAALRTSMAAELEATKKLIFANERTHKIQLDALEKRFLAARDGLQAEAAGRIAASRATYKLEVGRELEQESAAVRSENDALRHALKLHESTSDRLQREHAALTQKIHAHKQDLELRTQQNEEYLKKAQRQQKRIDKLTQETAAMEAQLIAAMQAAEATRERTFALQNNQIEALQTAVERARLEAGSVDRTNRQLRAAARCALADKKELERFFLLALEETKDTIRRRDAIQKKERALLQAAQLRELALPPALRTKLPAIAGSDAPDPNRPPVSLYGPALELKDLTLSERERVLRLLYAKVTHIPSGITVTLPPHSFAAAIGEAQAAVLQEQQAAAQLTQPALPQRSPLLSLPSTPLRPISALPAPASASLPELPASDAYFADATALPSELPGASYDSTFLTNFAADGVDDLDDSGHYGADEDDGGGSGDGLEEGRWSAARSQEQDVYNVD